MTMKHSATLFGLAALAAGLLAAVQPVSAAGLTHPASLTRTVADHDDSRN